MDQHGVLCHRRLRSVLHARCGAPRHRRARRAADSARPPVGNRGGRRCISSGDDPHSQGIYGQIPLSPTSAMHQLAELEACIRAPGHSRSVPPFRASYRNYCRGNVGVCFIRSACSRCRRWCLHTISKPVPTVKRSNGMKGFRNRMRLTSQAPARRIRARTRSLLRRNRSRTEGSMCSAGAIALGARARLLRDDGSIYVRMNHRPNHPGVMSCTGDGGRSSSAFAIAGK